MKLNKKGFMMAELIVVSSIVLIFLTSLYLSYNKIYTTYSERVDYYDAVTLYKLAYYKDSMTVNLSSAVSAPQVIVDASNERVLLVYNNNANLNSNILNNVTLSKKNNTFIDYISFLSTSVDLTDTKYVMIMEKCTSNDECKYAYLKIEE